MCRIPCFARALGRRGRWSSRRMVGGVTGAQNLSGHVALLWWLSQANYQDNGIFANHWRSTHLVGFERPILRGCVLYHLAHQPCEFRVNFRKLISAVWWWQQLGLTNCRFITSYRWMMPCRYPRHHVKRRMSAVHMFEEAHQFSFASANSFWPENASPEHANSGQNQPLVRFGNYQPPLVTHF